MNEKKRDERGSPGYGSSHQRQICGSGLMMASSSGCIERNEGVYEVHQVTSSSRVWLVVSCSVAEGQTEWLQATGPLGGVGVFVLLRVWTKKGHKRVCRREGRRGRPERRCVYLYRDRIGKTRRRHLWALVVKLASLAASRCVEKEKDE
jgi:hypothetical protein